MAGAIAIVVWLLVLPVLILMGGAIGAAIFGSMLTGDAEATHEGSELIDLDT